MLIPKTPEYQKLQSSVPFRDALIDALSNETLKMAIAAVRACATPTHIPAPTPGLHPDTATAHYHHMLVGLNQAFSLLEGLTMPPQKKLPSEIEYYYTLPPELQSETAPSHLTE